jgi:peptidoglycan/LPS O-acetylase OafA/YrhL
MDLNRMASAKVTYRPDIDGLRAVAVLLVLFNHVGIRLAQGGFIGVDVFFVISGYLISAHILKDIAEGQFSTARFYERRFRRIVPALLVMMAVTAILAHLYLFQTETVGFAQTELGALFSVSNVVLLHQGGYFDVSAKLKPLLHTWSLGVEEQFYIVFPLLLLAIARWFRSALRPILWSLTIAGFALSCVWLRHDALGAYYLALPRAWEFLFGTLLASGSFITMDTPWKRNAASALGLLLILRSAVHLSEDIPFPGWHALLPSLGALLILAAGESGPSLVGTLLSWSPIRAIGLISYSLYLWHWPIQVFQTLQNILVPERYPTWAANTAVIVASLVAGALSWRFIEQPFRTGQLKARLPLFALNGALAAVLLAFHVALIHSGGWSVAGVPDSELNKSFAEASQSPMQNGWGTCYFYPEDIPSHLASSCLADDASRKHYLILGDSHAAHLAWGLKSTFPEINMSLVAAAGCLPTPPIPGQESEPCSAYSRFIFDDYLVHHHVDTVLLIARWNKWNTVHIAEGIRLLRGRGINVILFGPSMEYDISAVRLLNRSRRQHDPYLMTRHFQAEPRVEDDRMKALARDQWHVPYISIFDDLCQSQWRIDGANAAGCPVYGAHGVSLLYDADHFSAPGSMLVANAIRQRHQLP